MNSHESKLERIGRQAMNIQMVEALMKSVDSEGEPIDGTEHCCAFIYNLEKISAEEVERLLNNNEYMFDPRILKTDLETASNVFPHRDESQYVTYWKSRAYANDFVDCECSGCGFRVPAIDAVKFGSTSTEYVGVKYRFCPNCGSLMSHKPSKNREEKNNE